VLFIGRELPNDVRFESTSVFSLSRFGFGRLAGFAKRSEQPSLLALRMSFDLEPLHDPSLTITTSITSSLRRCGRVSAKNAEQLAGKPII